MADSGLSPSDVFVLDHPTVAEIDPGRTAYALAEFLALDGDSFIAAVVRALFKREPLSVEYLEFSSTLIRKGKAAMINELVVSICNEC